MVAAHTVEYSNEFDSALPEFDYSERFFDFNLYGVGDYMLFEDDVEEESCVVFEYGF